LTHLQDNNDKFNEWRRRPLSNAPIVSGGHALILKFTPVRPEEEEKETAGWLALLAKDVEEEGQSERC
jgi:hypothetical protein